MRTDGFSLEILTPEKADVYVAYPAGNSIPFPLVKRLDEAHIRAITDSRDLNPDPQRVRQIMSECSALVVVLPHRASENCTTTPALVEEVRLGAELDLPIAILRERDVRAVVHESDHDLNLQFGDSLSIPVGREQVYGPILYSEQSGFSDEMSSVFGRFLEAE